MYHCDIIYPNLKDKRTKMALVELKKSDIENCKNEWLEDNEKLFFQCLNGYIELKPIESFSLTQEIIPLEYFELKPLSFFLNDDDLEEDKNDPDFLKYRIQDYIQEIGYNDVPEGFLVDRDCGKELYLDNIIHENRYEIIDKQVLIFKTCNLELRGAKYNSILKEVDMIKFIKRNYKAPENYEASSDIEGISTKPLVSSTLSDYKTPFIENVIDDELFRSWAICQFMKQLFKCTYDPFFEKDGLIHQKGRGYGKDKPKYELPENLNYYDLVRSLSLSREYHSNENMLRQS